MLNFNDDTFIKLNSLKEFKFYKVNDLTLINFLETTKHSILGYNLYEWDTNQTPTGEQLLKRDLYKSPTTGAITLGFNSNPQPYDKVKTFNKLLDHFTNTEHLGLRNRTLEQSLDLAVTKDLLIEHPTLQIVASNVKHTYETKLDDNFNRIVTKDQITFDLNIDGIVDKHTIETSFKSQRKLKRSVEQYVSDLLS